MAVVEVEIAADRCVGSDIPPRAACGNSIPYAWPVTMKSAAVVGVNALPSVDAGPSPRPPEKRNNDDEDQQGGKREVGPRLPLASRRLSKKMARMFSRHDRRPPRAAHSLARFSRAAVPRERSDAKTVESLRSPEMHNCLSADSRRTKDMPLHNPCTDYNVPAVAWLSDVLAASHELWVQACFRRLSGSVRLPGFRFQRGA